MCIRDRLAIREGIESRLQDSIDLALRLGEGLMSVLVQNGDDWDEKIYSTSMACIECGSSFEEIESRTFSFNSPYGACPTCDGLGHVGEKDAVDVCPDCSGGRLRAEARRVTIRDLAIHELTAMPLSEAATWIGDLASHVSELHRKVAEPIQREVAKRLEYL